MAKAGIEFEIKLTGAPADVAALRASRIFRAGRKRGWERLVSTYYDTPDRRLERAGASLRLREEGGARVQAMKLSRPGVLGRLEEEAALRPGDAFPRAPRRDEFIALLAHAGGALAPVSRTVSDRYSARIDFDDAVVEASLDLGRLERVEGETRLVAPLAEAEFELVDGDIRRVFGAARRCIEAADGRLRLSFTPKAEQARRLGLAAAPAAGADRVDLEPEASAGEALARALIQCAERLVELQPAVAGLRAPEGAHQARVTLRRFRSIERIFRRAARDEGLEKLSKEARRLAGVLGAARDLDVFLDETLAGAPMDFRESAGFRALRARATCLRARAWDRAAALAAGPDFSLFALSLLEAAARVRASRRARLSVPAHAFARKALDRRWRKAEKVAASLAEAAPAARHPLRIELKKLRYAAHLFRSLYPRERRKAYLGALGELQDVFGTLNDAVVAERLAARAAKGQGKDAARAAGFVAGWTAGEAAARADEALEKWRALASTEPFWR